MAQDEMILVAIEEMAKQLTEMKKSFSSANQSVEVDLTPINQKISKIQESTNEFKKEITNYYLVLKQVSNTISLIEGILQRERNSIVHTYVELKKPHLWIIGIIVYVLISFSFCFYLYQNNEKLKTEAEFNKANSLKYRFIKLRSDKLLDIIKYAKTTDELLYGYDEFFQKNQKEVEKYVIEKEEALKREFEASELAKQKQIEAKKAQQEAEQLKEKSENVKIKK